MRQRKGRFKAIVLWAGLSGIAMLTGCGASHQKEIVIYSNADDEAIDAMKAALDNNGYKGNYMIQTFATSELGGRLLAEGSNIEADLITMSSFYIDSIQEDKGIFQNLTFERNLLEEYPLYYAPITAQEGTIILNTEVMKELNLPTPSCLKDLGNPVYEGFLSVADIQGSTTGWLMIQALMDVYGEEEAENILSDIYRNAGDHLEASGSAPLRKIHAGEVAVGFGLRHQAVSDKEEGLPVDFVDPLEGNFSLTESIAVLDKGDKNNPIAMEMAECIVKNARQEILHYYPTPIYDGEIVTSNKQSAYPKTYSERLTIDLLEKHKRFSEQCK